MASTHRRKRRYAFDLLHLEKRDLMAGVQPITVPAFAESSVPDVAAKSEVGINLARISSYQSIVPFVDVSKSFRPWGSLATPWVSDESIPLSNAGDPLADAATFGELTYLPEGVYKLSWAGEATVKPVGYAGMTAKFLTTPRMGTDGRMHVDLLLQRSRPSDYSFSIQVTGIDQQNPFRDMKMIQPGYQENTTQAFTTQFLDKLKPFQTLRFVDWNVWGNPSVQWSERTLPSSPQWSGSKGVPYETMIDLSNTVNANPWITLPTNADDDYIRNLAELIKGRLEPGLTAYIEYSNEVWNYSGPSYRDHYNKALTNPALSAKDIGTRINQQTAFETHRIISIFQDVFDSQYAQRVSPVLASQAYNPATAKAQLSFYESKYGSPKDDGISLAIAPYFYTLGNTDNSAATADQLFESMRQQLETTDASIIASNAATARQYGIPMVAYEAGQHLAGGGVNHSVKIAMQDDPRMAQLYARYGEIWQQNGGSLNTYLNFAMQDTVHGYWGLLTSLDQPGTAKWDAVLKQTVPMGDATLDYNVDYSDFLILKGNYNKSGQYWQQGDFNGDGKINITDLNLLRNNMNSRRMTTSQLVEIMGFDYGAADPTKPNLTNQSLSGNINTAFDFGPTNSPVPSLTWKGVGPTTSYTPANGYGWTNVVGSLRGADRNQANALTRDLILGTDATFAANVPNGTYMVTIGLGDSGPYKRDDVSVFLENVHVETVTAMPGTILNRNYLVNVTDGVLTLRLVDRGGTSPEFALSTLRFTKVLNPASGFAAMASTTPASAILGSNTITYSYSYPIPSQDDVALAMIQAKAGPKKTT